MKSVKVIVVSAVLVALTGCAGGFKVQLPGVNLGSSSSSSAAANEPNAGPAQKKLKARAVDCDKVKADPNGVQPTEEEKTKLSEVSRKIQPSIGNFDVRVEGMASVPAAEAVIAENKAKFGPWWCSAQWQDGSYNPNEHERLVLDLEKRIAQVRDSESSDAPTAKKNFEAALTKASTRLSEYRAKPTLKFDGYDSLRSKTSNDVQTAINLTAKYHLLQLKWALGETHADVVAAQAAMDKAQADVDAAIDEIDAKLAESFEVPKDDYKGKDAAAVKAAFTKYVASSPGLFNDKKDVLLVVLTTDWERKTGSDWRGETLVHYDHSWIHGKVVTKLNDKTGEVWEIIARKDHIDQDKIKFDTYIPSQLGKIALAKVKKK